MRRLRRVFLGAVAAASTGCGLPVDTGVDSDTGEATAPFAACPEPPPDDGGVDDDKPAPGYVFNEKQPPAPAGAIPNFTFIANNATQFKQNWLFAARPTTDARLMVAGAGPEIAFFTLRPEVFHERNIEKPFLYAKGEIDVHLGVFNNFHDNINNRLTWDDLAEIAGYKASAMPLSVALCSTRTPQTSVEQYGGHNYVLSEAQQPTACGHGADCYQTTLVWTVRPGETSASEQLWSIDVDVRVGDAKTNQARVTSAVALPHTVRRSPVTVGTASFPGNGMLEQTITGDGRLIVFHGGGGGGLLYSMNTSTTPCRADKWTQFHSVSKMYVDPDVAHYGVAKYPFRSSEGEPFQPGEVVRGTYPWIDQSGSNLFFGTASTPLASPQNTPDPALRTPLEWRYSDVPSGQTDWFTHRGGYLALKKLAEQVYHVSLAHLIVDPNVRNGEAVAGLWTKGKTVLLDGRLNSLLHTTSYQPLDSGYQEFCSAPGSTIYGFGQLLAQCDGMLDTATDCTRFQCELADLRYRGDRLFLRAYDGAAENELIPIFGMANTSIVSTENTWNFMPQLRPVTTSDVSWLVSTGHTADYVHFDTMLDKDALIASDMMPSESFVTKTYGEYDVNTLNHGLRCQYNGEITNPNRVCAGYAGSAQPRVQNIATSHTLPGVALRPPAYGALHGGARIETAASGGITGRGVYLDGGDDFIEYRVAAAPSFEVVTAEAPAPKSWFVGLWLNPSDVAGGHNIVTLSDGTSIGLVARGGQQRIIVGRPEQAVDGTEQIFVLPPALHLGPTRWSHLAFNARPESNGTDTSIEIYVDGYRLDATVMHSGPCTQPFHIRPGVVRLGAATATRPGFAGWVDEFKVSQAWLLPTEICGHAYGRLVGSDTATHLTNAYPPASHAFISQLLGGDPEESYPFYFCERHDPDHFDFATELAGKVCIGNDGSDPRCVTDRINFPEGPVHRNAPRPDATANGFCRRCHQETNQSPTLQVTAALGAGVDPFSLSHDVFDRRRQPSNPPRKVYGYPGSLLEDYGVVAPDPRGNQIDFLSFDP